MKKNVLNVVMGALTIAVGMFLYEFVQNWLEKRRGVTSVAPSEIEE